MDYGEYSEFRVDSSEDIELDPARPWSNYFRGVAEVLRRRGLAWVMGEGEDEDGDGDTEVESEASVGRPRQRRRQRRPRAQQGLRGMDAAIVGDIPRGAGLSSSAALEVASMLALLSATGVSPESFSLKHTERRRRIALACREAENDFVGVRCGIMDQIASVIGRAGHAVLLDCRTLHHELVPLPLDQAQLSLVVFNTGIRRKLVESEYNRRRFEVECGTALIARALASEVVHTLRDVSPSQFTQVHAMLPETIARRCDHVISENQRAMEAAAALRRRSYAESGELMYRSHESLRDLYEVSCAELDADVEIARATPGVIGARMTGAGFGGCTINLVKREAATALMSRLAAAGLGGRSDDRFGGQMAFGVEIADGARIIS